jgi:hypothetical protein
MKRQKEAKLMTAPKRSKKPVPGISQTADNTDPVASLKMKLKTADPEIQHYVVALEAENLKFARQVGKLQAENMTLNNRITAIKEGHDPYSLHGFSNEELERRIQDLQQKGEE